MPDGSHAHLPLPDVRGEFRLDLKALTDTATERRIVGIASTPTPDRMGDIVEPKGALFNLPMPLLAFHNSRQPIGDVISAKVTDKGIEIEGIVKRDTGLDYVEEAWKQIKAKLVRTLSIGFRPLEWNFIEATGGIHFLKWEWLELSTVTIPAQADATIEYIKALDRRAVFAALGKNTPPASSLQRAAFGAPLVQGKIMRLSERIEAKQTLIAGLRDQVANISANFSERDPTEEEALQLEELGAQIDDSSKALVTMTKAEAVVGQRIATPPSSGQQIIVPRRTIQRAKADLIFKAAVVHLCSQVNKQSLADVCKERYPTDDDVAVMVKAAVNPADTVTPGWAAELVGTQIAEFVDVLAPVSVYGALAAMSLRITFDRNGIIKVPARNKTPNLAGVFVGEGAPIPVKKGSLGSVTLAPHKAAVISTFTRELAQLSNPSIEQVIREAIIEDTGVQIDSNLLDAAAGTAIRPPGLLNGVTTIPSSGNTAAEIAADMRALLTAVTAVGGGRKLALIINPQRVVGLSTVTNATGQFLYRDEVAQGTLFGAKLIISTDVPPDVVILVDAADYVTATGDAPEWDVSDVATIHEEDTTPLPIVAGGTAATPVRSLWQTASIGIRMIWPLTWAMRRPGMVAALSGVGW